MPAAGTRITDPFVVVTETQPTTNPAGNIPSNGPTPPPDSHRPPNSDAMRVSEGGNKRPSTEVSLSSNAAANLKSKIRWIAPPDDALANNRGVDFGHLAPPESSTQNNMLMPQRINLHESGLRRSPHLKELAEQKTKQQLKPTSHGPRNCLQLSLSSLSSPWSAIFVSICLQLQFLPLRLSQNK